MRGWLLIIACTFIYSFSFGQKDKPRIEGQRAVSVDEDQQITIQMTDLFVRDRDDWFYPFGFSMSIHPGENYTFETNVVTPTPNFAGKLRVNVSVNDGEFESDTYAMDITVRAINDAPVVTGQAELTVNENESINVKLSDLTINDPDDNKFTYTLASGSNYTLSGTTITPAKDFSGTLSVPVQVSDGKITSLTFALKITVLSVNNVPMITAQSSLSVDAGKAITILLSNLTVVDVDNPYPTGFSLHITPPTTSNYTLSGSTVTPALTFAGTLSIPVRVNDGKDFSEPFNLQITVRPGNSPPVITGQTAVTINEDEQFSLLFSHLTVTDTDNTYPSGFTMKVSAGANYTATNTLITPTKDFFGKLVVPVSVSDGSSDSAPYNFEIMIVGKNDPPVISLEPEPLIYQPGKGAMALSSSLQITDAENDSIVKAEISFFPQTYLPAIDELKFTETALIKGSFDLQRGTLVLSGKTTLANYVSAIKTISYNFLAGPEIFAEGKKFSIIVSDRFAASAPATREIRTKALDIDLDIPTAFTPNGDQANDTWKIKTLKASEELNRAIVRIYSRGGQVVFETIGFEKEWDGRLNGELLPCDSYFYTIDLGKNYPKSSLKGIVTILR